MIRLPRPRSRVSVTRSGGNRQKANLLARFAPLNHDELIGMEVRVVHEVGDAGGTTALLRRVAERDESAWRELVDRNNAMVWGTARAYSSSVADAEDVYQATWLILAENLDRLREPEALPGWLVTTARRESIRLAKARQRESPVGLGNVVIDSPDHCDGPENKVLRSMMASRLWQAFAQLPQRCQQLLRIVAVAPETSYAQVSESLGLPRGSIGPKRRRCLTSLRERMASAGVPEEAAG